MRETGPDIRRRGLLTGGAAALLSGAMPRAAERTAAPSPATAPLFATDIRLPGMLHAVVARPPLPGWRLTGLDASAALAVKGIVAVIPLGPCGLDGFEPNGPVIASEAKQSRDPQRSTRKAGLLRFARNDGPEPFGGADLLGLGGVAVLARDTWSALRGRDALRPAWEAGAPIEPAGAGGAAFFVPETAEPLMETPCATVRADGRLCAAWASLREPERVRAALAALLGLPAGAVTLHATAPACGFERVSNPAMVLEAARLSRAANAPVSLVWTSADDIPFRARPAGPLA